MEKLSVELLDLYKKTIKSVAKNYVLGDGSSYWVGYLRGIIECAGLSLSFNQVSELENYINSYINLYEEQLQEKQKQRALEISE
jgi:hypothetical protein